MTSIHFWSDTKVLYSIDYTPTFKNEYGLAFVIIRIKFDEKIFSSCVT